jgi:hypothetical protein
MKKIWKIDGSSAKYDTLEAALDKAKRMAGPGACEYGVFELVAVARSKIPDVDVITTFS